MTSPFDPNRSPAENLAALRDSGNKVFLVSTGPRDTGQSDFKNRLTFGDLIGLAPRYEDAGYFAVELHGGARFHQDLMQNKVDPFEETRAWKDTLRHTMTQTLIRSTNAFGYRAYPKNVLRKTVEAFLPTIDVWRCFDFLNHIENMVPVGETVLAGGKIFQPAISYTESDDTTDEYYLGVTARILQLFGGEKNVILAIKDMAGVGSPARIHRLVDAMLQRWPDLVINYHRHSTDGLGVPAVVAAAAAGAKLIDVTDDAFSRFYGEPPVRAVCALLRERGLDPAIDEPAVVRTNEVVRGFMRGYKMWESPFQGFAYDVRDHRMPGGAFPSSFEQAEKGGFLDLMSPILRGMALGNKIIKYFDVTPGSQISWTTWASIIQRAHKEEGDAGVERVLDVLTRFVEDSQDFQAVSHDDREVLLKLYSGATDDLKNLLLGAYGPLPFGWPADWVYHSAFGAKWKEATRDRSEKSEALKLEDEDIDAARQRLDAELGRAPTEQELILYLQHPRATVNFLQFREKYGDTRCLPTRVWFHGLEKRGDAVDFELDGKPQRIELVSIGQIGDDGMRHIVLSVNNTMMVFPVEMPDVGGTARQVTRLANTADKGEIGATVKGTLWRIGDRKRVLAVGDFVHKGEEVANLEVMKTENMVVSAISGTVTELVAEKNQTLEVGQLIMVIEPGDKPRTDAVAAPEDGVI